MKDKKERIKKAHIFVLLFLLILIPLALYLITSLDNKSTRYRLNIISSYGDKEAYHPKVIAFKEKWNGYKYWMSFTPYPKGKSAKENPHIVASNDLINWEVPKGLKNPLDEVDNILINGTKAARKRATATMKKVKKSMQIDYYEE